MNRTAKNGCKIYVSKGMLFETLFYFYFSAANRPPTHGKIMTNYITLNKICHSLNRLARRFSKIRVATLANDDLGKLPIISNSCSSDNDDNGESISSAEIGGGVGFAFLVLSDFFCSRCFSSLYFLVSSCCWKKFSSMALRM